MPFFILGNGSNLLVADEGYRGIVLSISKMDDSLYLENETTICCNAGAMLAKVCVFAMKNNLSGLEFAWGIPGTCGGALFMNAGAYGNEMADIIYESTHIKPDGTKETFKKDELKLSYRKSIYSEKPFVITSMKLKLTKSNSKNIREKMLENISKRKSKQPLDLPSAGSTFKRPEGHYAGALIQECGLKGAKIGGAMVSEKHAGFVVNIGNATAQDVVSLIRLIKNRVYKEKGILLECEVKTLGNITI